jgi:hypothetical protein
MTEIKNAYNNQEEEIIVLPCIKKTHIYHYGSQANYQRFRYSYFTKEVTKSKNETILHKYIINSVQYVPDEVYSSLLGIAGKCWIVTINDIENDKLVTYYIRNWIDIVEFYKEKGLKFVEEK